MIENVRPSPIIAANFDRIEKNRAAIMLPVRRLNEEQLWTRPAENRWAIGEQLIHLNTTLRLFAITLQALTPFLYPFAWAKRNRQYERTMINVFVQEDYRPIKAPAPLDPKQRRQTMTQIEEHFDAALRSARHYFLSLDEQIAGNMILPYPPTKGTASVLQYTFAFGYHEQHHFRSMARIDESLRVPGVSDEIDISSSHSGQS